MESSPSQFPHTPRGVILLHLAHHESSTSIPHINVLIAPNCSADGSENFEIGSLVVRKKPDVGGKAEYCFELPRGLERGWER